MKKIFTLVLLYLPFVTFSQDLTGTWEGSGGGTTYIRMVVKQRGDSLIGYTYDEGSGHCTATFIGRYDQKEKRLIGRGVEMIEGTSNHVLVDYDLLYSKEAGGEFLRENMGEPGFFARLFSPGNRQHLKKTSKKIDFVAKTSRPKGPVPPKAPVEIKEPVPVKKPQPVVAKTAPSKTVPVTTPVAKPAVVTKKPVVVIPVKQAPVLRRDSIAKIAPPRKIEIIPAPAALLKKKDERSSKLVETIYTSSDTLKMFVYDNGEVDGDTVTVFFDNSVILNRYRISDKAKELSLPISKNGQEHSIELFANNLGTIPPNTALIIIMAGKRRYELRASYDLVTNAKIIIRYKE